MRPSTSPDLVLIQNVAMSRAKFVSTQSEQSHRNTIAIPSLSVGPRPPLPPGGRGRAMGVALNPLMPSPTQNSGQSIMGLNMMIVGQQHGEEKTVSATEIRRVNTPGEEAQTLARQQRSESIHTKDQQRIRKLEADVKRLQDQLKQKSDDYDTLQNMADVQRNTISRLEAEKEKFGFLLDGEQRKKSDECDALRQKIVKMQLERDELVASHNRQKKELENTFLERIDREKQALDEERAKNIASFRQKDEDCRNMIAKMKTEIDALQKQFRQRDLEHDQDLAKMKGEKGSQKEVEEKLRNEIRQLRGELVAQAATVEEAKRQSKAFYDYMVNICQPQFTVVKDEKMTPMDPQSTHSQAAEGFVMVPLKLLLEGYALLPIEMKRKIADEYAEDIKSGRAPPANAGNFAVGKVEHPSASAIQAGSIRKQSTLRRSSDSK